MTNPSLPSLPCTVLRFPTGAPFPGFTVFGSAIGDDEFEVEAFETRTTDIQRILKNKNAADIRHSQIAFRKRF